MCVTRPIGDFFWDYLKAARRKSRRKITSLTTACSSRDERTSYRTTTKNEPPRPPPQRLCDLRTTPFPSRGAAYAFSIGSASHTVTRCYARKRRTLFVHVASDRHGTHRTRRARIEDNTRGNRGRDPLANRFRGCIHVFIRLSAIPCDCNLSVAFPLPAYMFQFAYNTRDVEI